MVEARSRNFSRILSVEVSLPSIGAGAPDEGEAGAFGGGGAGAGAPEPLNKEEELEEGSVVAGVAAAPSPTCFAADLTGISTNIVGHQWPDRTGHCA